MIQASMRNKYFENSIQTATPAQLLIMLYDGAIRFSKIGIDAIHKKDYPVANENLGKVQSIMNELIVTMDRNSSIAKTLLPLYQYMNTQLVQANLKKDAALVEEVLGYLTELRETWIQASKSISTSQPQVQQHG